MEGTSAKVEASSKGQVGKAMEDKRGYMNKNNQPASNKIIAQVREIRGKMAVSQAPAATFSEHHLKQMRAQCLVYLAFRNKLMPKKLHLDIALGNFIPRQDGSNKHQKGEDQSIDESNRATEVAKSYGKLDHNAIETETTGPSSSAARILSVSEENLLKEAEKPSRMNDYLQDISDLTLDDTALVFKVT